MNNRILDHINIGVPDLKKAVKFYTVEMGFTVTGHFTEVDGTEFYYLDLNGTPYELMEEKTFKTAKIQHIAYKSIDLLKDYQYFNNKGYKILSDGIGHLPNLWDNGVNYFLVEGPFKEVIEFCTKL